MQLGDAQAFLAKVDARHLGAAPRHRLGEDAAAAADVEHLLAGEAGGAVDPFQAQRVDLVQRPELALRVPPAVRELAENFSSSAGSAFMGSILETKSPAEAGLSGDRKKTGQFRRVPMTSISVRRFLARPSAVLLLATGCFSPLPSV